MKKFTKVCLIAAAVCGILGLGFLVGGFALGGSWQDVVYAFDRGDFSFGDEIDIEISNHHASHSYEDIKKIKVDMNYGGLYFEPSKDGKITVELEGTVGKKTTVTQDGDELKIENNMKNTARHGSVTVFCPKDIQLEELDINMGAGETIISTPIQAQEVDVEVGAGIFEGTEVISAKESSWEVGAGEIVMDSIAGDHMAFDCRVGQIDVTVLGKQESYNYKVDCGVGSIEIGDDDYSGLGTEKKITSKDNKGRQIEVSCSVGAVILDFNE